jgi:hypothetical protein
MKYQNSPSSTHEKLLEVFESVPAMADLGLILNWIRKDEKVIAYGKHGQSEIHAIDYLLLTQRQDWIKKAIEAAPEEPNVWLKVAHASIDSGDSEMLSYMLKKMTPDVYIHAMWSKVDSPISGNTNFLRSALPVSKKGEMLERLFDFQSKASKPHKVDIFVRSLMNHAIQYNEWGIAEVVMRHARVLDPVEVMPVVFGNKKTPVSFYKKVDHYFKAKGGRRYEMWEGKRKEHMRKWFVDIMGLSYSTQEKKWAEILKKEAATDALSTEWCEDVVKLWTYYLVREDRGFFKPANEEENRKKKEEMESFWVPKTIEKVGRMRQPMEWLRERIEHPNNGLTKETQERVLHWWESRVLKQKMQVENEPQRPKRMVL